MNEVDDVLDKYGYRVQNLMGRSQSEERNIASAELRELVLGCLHKELIIPAKEWNEMTEAQMDYVNGRNAENREVRIALNKLFEKEKV